MGLLLPMLFLGIGYLARIHSPAPTITESELPTIKATPQTPTCALEESLQSQNLKAIENPPVPMGAARLFQPATGRSE